MSLEEFLSEWNNDSPFIEVKTSGSTGEPKRMLVEKRRMLASGCWSRSVACSLPPVSPATSLVCAPVTQPYSVCHSTISLAR